jgi:hypothetical protein
LRKWFGTGPSVGVGIPCGPASGNLAVLNFETPEAFDQWCATIPADEAAGWTAVTRPPVPTFGH